MPVLDRLVRRLRLTASREDHARHGRVLLEDALRTATFGDEARLILIRRLDLGTVSATASSTQWSRRLEQRFQQSRVVPVSVNAPDAASAEAVYFNTSHEPWLLLARRALAGQPALEWFWRSAMPDWKPALSTADTLRLCVRTLAARGGLPLTLELIATLPANVSPTALFESLEPADLATLRTELGFPLSINAPPAAANALLSLRPPELTTLERRFVATWGPTDIRTHWLAAARLTAVSSHRFSIRPDATVTAVQIQQLVQHWHRESASNHPFPHLSAPVTSGPPPLGAPATRRHSEEPATLSSRLNSEALPPPEPTPLTTPESAPLERLFTQAGGLFFLIPLLQRDALPTFLDLLPDSDRAVFPWQLLRLALRHARTSADDPLVTALRDLPVCAQPLGHWLLATNRHALRLTSLNLRQLIQRPALVTLTPTHIDVFFRAREADLRLRRAALDLDPGWVGWLGRAVSYHFTRED